MTRCAKSSIFMTTASCCSLFRDSGLLLLLSLLEGVSLLLLLLPQLLTGLPLGCWLITLLI